MFWKSKSKDTQQSPAETTQSGLPVTEQPFFNVMPRTRVTVVPHSSAPSGVPPAAVAPHGEPAPVPLKAPTPPVAEQVVNRSQEIRVTTPPPAVTSPMVTTSPAGVMPDSTPAIRTKKVVKIIAVIACVTLAGFAVWYATSSLGPYSSSGGVKAMLQRLSFFGGKTTTTPSATVQPAPEPAPVEPSPTFETTVEWRTQYFTSADCDPTQCGDAEDPDQDGLQNLKEFQLATNPTNLDSDSDGLVDGDEVHVFSCSPLDIHTAGDATYTDADDLKGGWDCGRPAGSTDKMSDDKLKEIQKQTVANPLHEATLKTLGDAVTRYQLDSVMSSATPPEANPTDVPAQLPDGFDAAPEALLERDLQRLGTVKKVGVALVKYQKDNKTVPDVADFAALVLKLKAYIIVATNAQDPVNKPPFVYTYDYLQDGQDFNLNYYSETQKQLIRYTSVQAKRDADAEGAVTRDGQRVQDLEKIRSALLIYSAATVQSNKSFNFPQASQYKQKMVPQYVKALPTDPSTGKDYEYSAAKDGATFTLRVPMENPASGTSGYVCNQDACQTY